jgi:hypothetical protein
MYIANCSSQNVDFIYRMPRTPAPRMQNIPIGRQIKISGDLQAPDIEMILKQHAKYGLIHVSEIDRTRPYAGMCWSEKPISVERLKRQWLHNQGVLAERGKTQRQQAAVATMEQINESSGGNALKALEMSVEEVPTEGKPDTDFAEGVRVTPDLEETGGKGTKPGRGKSRSRED